MKKLLIFTIISLMSIFSIDGTIAITTKTGNKVSVPTNDEMLKAVKTLNDKISQIETRLDTVQGFNIPKSAEPRLG